MPRPPLTRPFSEHSAADVIRAGGSILGSPDSPGEAITVRCLNCGGEGYPLKQPIEQDGYTAMRYAQACSTHGRFTRWCKREVEVQWETAINSAQRQKGV